MSAPADQGLAARALAEQTRQHMEAAKAEAEAVEAAQREIARLLAVKH